MSGGFVVLDKPSGVTSREAVDHAQRWFPRIKLGHAGTLDPAATGVLVVGVGPAATRLIEYVQQQEKVYHSTFVLGATSTTDDGDGEITPCGVVAPPVREVVESALRAFLGTLSQTPPDYSAALVKGQRAYSKARRGEKVALAPRPVVVHHISLLRYDYPKVEVEITCGKGTYIRSLARDLGVAVRTGAYVAQLRRTRNGPFTTEMAVGWDATADQARARMEPLLAAIPTMQRLIVTTDERGCLRQGQWLRGERASLAASGETALLLGDQLVGLGTYDASERILRPLKMFQAG